MVDKTSLEWQLMNARCNQFAELQEYNSDRKIIAFCTREFEQFKQAQLKGTA